VGAFVVEEGRGGGGLVLKLTWPVVDIVCVHLQALSVAPRQAFSLEWDKVKKEIADEKAGILSPPTVPKAPLVVTLGKNRKPAAKGKGEHHIVASKCTVVL